MKRVLLLVSAFMFALGGHAQTWDEVVKQLPTPQSVDLDDSYFGTALDIDGDFAVVGASGNHDQRGVAYVFYYNGTSWEKQAELLASDAGTGDLFGSSVAISGDNIVVGAQGDFTNRGSAYVFTKTGLIWKDTIETAKLTASDANSQDRFGWSVDIYGDDIVAGAYQDDDQGSNSGSAYIFTKPTGGWTTATETAKFTASDGVANARLGFDVAIFSDYMIAGADGDDDSGTYSGSVYVFKKTVSGWTTGTEFKKLTASDGASGNYFGASVDLNMNHIVAGAMGNSLTGAAYIFNIPNPMDEWLTTTETSKVVASDGTTGAEFGRSISISDTTMIVGSHKGNLSHGTAYVFGVPSATQIAKLSASNPTNWDGMGWSVGVSGDRILTGVRLFDSTYTNQGAVYAFNKAGSAWIDGTEDQIILQPSYYTNVDNQFGRILAIDGDYAVIAAVGTLNRGLAYVFHYNGTTWVKQAELLPSDTILNHDFATSVDIDGDVIVVGAINDENNTYIGAAYVFVKSGANWADMSETAKLSASDGMSYDAFGRSVGVSGDLIVVGADRGDGILTNTGAAYVFTKPMGGWANATETCKLHASNGAGNDDFGDMLSVSGDDIVICARETDQNGTGTGSAYVFTKPSGGWTDTSETAILTGSGTDNFDRFGRSVDLSNGVVVIGCDDKDFAYVYEKPVGGWVSSTEKVRLTGSDVTFSNRTGFGNSVSVDGKYIVVGSYQDDDNGNSSGAAYIFERPDTGWADATEISKLIASDGDDGDFFGFSVAVSRNHVVVGANRDDHYGRVAGVAGSAYFYLKGCSNTTSSITASACDTYTSPSGKIWTVSNSYTDTILIAGGCDSMITINLTIDTIHLGVDKNENTLSSSISNASYQWIDCADNSDISGANGQSFTPTSSGDYACVVTNGTCSDTTICTSVEIVLDGINGALNNQIQLYPNPAKNFLNVKSSIPVELVEIYNVLGVNVGRSDQLKISVSTLSKGVYVLKIRTQQGEVIRRFTKE